MWTVLHLVLVAALATVGHAAPRDLQPRAIDCSDSRVKALVSLANAIAGDKVDPFCSTYLHYTQPVTTVTITATSVNVVTSTVTKGDTTITKTVTEGGGKAKRNCLNARAETLAADSAGKVLGYASDIVSGACSCLVTKPTKTSTVTKTTKQVTNSVTTVTVKETKTKTVTVKPSTTKTSTTTKKTSTTKTSSTKKATSTTKPSAISLTSTSSLGPNPTFYIQFQDPDPSVRSDAYNNQYLGSAPDEYRGTGEGAVWTPVPLLAAATLLTLELDTHKLKAVGTGYYGEAEYFLNLTPVYFDTPQFISDNQFYYTDCTITGGYMTCSVPYPSFRNVIQTCPEYVAFYYTPIALGDHEYTDGPVCYRKNMKVIPV